MKAQFHWLMIVVLLFAGICSLSASALPTMPKRSSDYLTAYSFYTTGVNQTPINPKLAVESFRNAQKYIQLAVSEGAGDQAIRLSQSISKALTVAENKQKTGPVNNTASTVRKPVKKNITIRSAPLHRTSVVVHTKKSS